MAATVSATNIKNAMKAALDAIDASNGSISNDAGLQAIADAVANEVNATIVASYTSHTHPYIDSQGDAATPVASTTSATTTP